MKIDEVSFTKQQVSAPETDSWKIFGLVLSWGDEQRSVCTHRLTSGDWRFDNFQESTTLSAVQSVVLGVRVKTNLSQSHELWHKMQLLFHHFMRRCKLQASFCSGSEEWEWRSVITCSRDTCHVTLRVAEECARRVGFTEDKEAGEGSQQHKPRCSGCEWATNRSLGKYWAISWEEEGLIIEKKDKSTFLTYVWFFWAEDRGNLWKDWLIYALLRTKEGLE